MDRYYRELDGGSDDCGLLPPSLIGLKGVMAEERPLVHLFLIQKNMAYDALQAVSRYCTFVCMMIELDVVWCGVVWCGEMRRDKII